MQKNLIDFFEQLIFNKGDVYLVNQLIFNEIKENYIIKNHKFKRFLVLNIIKNEILIFY
jgi:hypothetical protein